VALLVGGRSLTAAAVWFVLVAGCTPAIPRLAHSSNHLL